MNWTEFGRFISRTMERMADLQTRQLSRLLNERGAHFVEMAVFLPLLLLVILASFDIAKVGGVYAAVHSAVNLASRRAPALLRSEWTAVDAAFGPPGAGPIAGTQSTTADLSTLLNSTPEFQNGIGATQWYQDMAQGQASFEGEVRTQLTELFRIEARGIALANYSIFNNVGGSFPCDADDPGGEPGCFRCFTLRGDQSGYINVFSLTGNGGDNDWENKVLALRCDYDVPLFSAGLFGLTNYWTVSSTSYISIDDYSAIFFNPAA